MYVKVRAHTGMKKEEVVEKSADHFDISVKEPPLQNLANRRIVELVARRYGVPERRVHLVSGHRSPSKILAVDTDARPGPKK